MNNRNQNSRHRTNGRLPADLAIHGGARGEDFRKGA